MQGIDTGRDKVKKICDILRKETIEPAQQEAQQIVHGARTLAQEIIAEARLASEKIQEEAQQEIQRQKNVFEASLNQACKQALEILKQNIEEKFFNQELSSLIARQMQEPKVLVELIEAVIKAVEKEGLEAVLSVSIPAAVPARSVNLLLAKEMLEKLKEKSVLLGNFEGGIEVKLHKENITLDISDHAIKEIVANYIRKDFRELIFSC